MGNDQRLLTAGGFATRKDSRGSQVLCFLLICSGFATRKIRVVATLGDRCGSATALPRERFVRERWYCNSMDAGRGLPFRELSSWTCPFFFVSALEFAGDWIKTGFSSYLSETNKPQRNGWSRFALHLAERL